MQGAPVALPVNVDTTGAKILDGDGLSGPDQRDSRDIWLPNWVETVSHIAVDIGGSLAKVVYFTRTAKPTQSKSLSNTPSSSSLASSFQDVTYNGTLHPKSSSSPSASPTSSHPSLPGSSPTSRLHSRESSTDCLAERRPDSTIRSHSPHLSPYPHNRVQTAEGSVAIPGGTLTPTSLFTNHAPVTPSAMNSHLLTRRALPSQLPGGRLNFIKFETENIHDCVTFLQELISSSAKANNVSLAQMRKGVKLMATGGGAHKFQELFQEELGVEVRREDEMSCLITGLNFITLIPDEAYYYSDELVDSLNSTLPQAKSSSPGPFEKGPIQDQLPRPSPDPPLYAPVFESNPLPKLPCLLVNIGSGVSIIKVDDHGKFERVSGTSLGGGTLWGLLSLLTDADSFDEMLELASHGDNGTVDMLVSDIYGSSDALNSLGLKSNTIASSFGKVFRKEDTQGGESRQGAREKRKKKFRQEDICKSLLYAVSNNIGQIAYMNAEKFGLDRIYFGGCFIRGHQATIATLSYAIRFWSKGTKRAFFLRHEGYLGAVGCWIKQLSDPNPKVKDALRKSKTRNDVNYDSSESKASTPKSNGVPNTNGLGSDHLNGINPILAEALGDVSIADHNPSSSRQSKLSRASTNGHLEGLDTVVVASDDVKALENQGEIGTTELNSLIASISKEDQALLGPLLKVGSTDEALSVAELLKQLDDANGAADGLESKLDSLLGRLDLLLEDDK